MINIDGQSLTFSNMGLFDSETKWIHPEITVDSYELIFVIEGSVYIAEGGKEYELFKGDMLLLSPFIPHKGYRESKGHTSFFWLHFYCSSSALLPPKVSKPSSVCERTMREIMHYQYSDKRVAEVTFLKFLLERDKPSGAKNKIAYEVEEYIRINSHRALSVSTLAERFGYSPDHLSRLLSKEFGYDCKRAIIKKRLDFIESQLLNTDFSIKEVAEICGFEDENAFVKFYKYHTSSTPSQFRRRFFYTHMNTELPTS